MFLVNKEEILDFPYSENSGTFEFIYNCIHNSGLDDREDEAFELAKMIIEGYQNIINSVTAYEIDINI